MTAIRMINATKSTAPKEAATIITVGEGLLLSPMRTPSVDFSGVGVKTEMGRAWCRGRVCEFV